MKIYINDYNLKNIPTKFEKLKHYFVQKTNFIMVYSDEGIYKINENSVQKLNIVSDNTRTLKENIIIDESVIHYEECNYIPYFHIANKITKHIYRVSPKSKLNLVIETISTENDEINMKPYDFYFESSIVDNIYNSIIKDDLNVFLSALN